MDFTIISIWLFRFNLGLEYSGPSWFVDGWKGWAFSYGRWSDFRHVHVTVLGLTLVAGKD